MRELSRANEILKSAAAFFAADSTATPTRVIRYIDSHRDKFGVEPICEALQVAPSTYYAAKKRPPSVRAVRDVDGG